MRRNETNTAVAFGNTSSIALTEEQEKLLADIAEAKENLPQEQKEGDPVPAVFEGDDLVYNAATGEFVATGKVDIIQIDGHRFQSNEAYGNVNLTFAWGATLRSSTTPSAIDALSAWSLHTRRYFERPAKKFSL